MKSIIVASALALAATADSMYYIGNYSAGSTKRIMAFPLETCVPNGAGTFNYVVYHCTPDNLKVYSEVYESDDPTCESEYTETEPWNIVMSPAQGGYADCSGQQNYAEVFQYLGSCSSWEKGMNPIATTIISSDACTFYMVDSGTGYPLYTKMSCTGDEQTTSVYVGDPTCSGSPYIVTTAELGCDFFMNTTTLGSIYSAMSRCVINNVVDRCSMPISAYTTHLQFWGLKNDTNLEDLYMRMFPYSGMDIVMTGMAPNVNLTLDLTFCTEWEDRKYGAIVKDLGQATLDALNYAATICYMCTESDCVNTTMCDPGNCIETERCVPTTTSTETPETTSSVSAVSVSIFTFLMTLIASLF